MEWHSPSVENPPMGRRSHSALNYDGKLLIFGGYNSRESQHFNDLWLYDPKIMRWIEWSPHNTELRPNPRRRQAMCLVGESVVQNPAKKNLQAIQLALCSRSIIYILISFPLL